jgi:hypothetical protein
MTLNRFLNPGSWEIPEELQKRSVELMVQHIHSLARLNLVSLLLMRHMNSAPEAQSLTGSCI